MKILENKDTDTKLKILVLWMFVFFNMIFRDLHELGRTGFLQQMITGIVNGVKITEVLLLIGGIMIEIPLLILPLTLLLPQKGARLANILMGILMIPLNISIYNPPDLDDKMFLFFEIAALLLIVWYAWHWLKQSQKTPKNTAPQKKDK